MKMTSFGGSGPYAAGADEVAGQRALISRRDQRRDGGRGGDGGGGGVLPHRVRQPLLRAQLRRRRAHDLLQLLNPV
jgi:hypothetical protein